MNSQIVFRGTSRSFWLHNGPALGHETEVQRGGIRVDCNSALRRQILVPVPRSAWRLQCQLVLETAFVGNSGYEIGDCFLGPDIGEDAAGVCWKR